MALIAEDLAVERGGRLALAAPDFRIEAGEAALVAGPNGAGKSTLLRALAGLSPLKRGRVMFEGAADVAAHVAYAGHLDAVKPALSVRANLRAWAAIYRSGGDVDDALARLGLAHIADEPAAFCSAGQKRRLGLARLLVAGRRIWLLDEPTVSLDAASVAALSERIAAHCRAGGIAVVATHVEFGLPKGPRIELTAPEVGADAVGDPFLAGAWA
ncbi:heme ABC exporter ATP-binding protein CcmA [Pikeienuella piscinae]|uniref:Heme ABC exporter ATP-binding protein CcmA n=1 Tax=Pikeienuella piscinae TaxID=2748098 RepID=A0A7L5BZ85_9RHOB|nr:heme ABC exporter ATP-binding protein CcmA [Pikeienuella piscinae]QIE56413.1 heme ABC exporter ATP-binding protein CcmA [Pikeienuella piscinae]